MDPNKTIRTTAAGRRAAAARDGRISASQAKTKPLLLASAPAHTPGTWHEHAGSVVADIGERYTRLVADCFHYLPENRLVAPIEEARANARLIAAAPEMIVALEQADHWLEAHNASRDPVQAVAILEEIRAAIRKAKG